MGRVRRFWNVLRVPRLSCGLRLIRGRKPETRLLGLLPFAHCFAHRHRVEFPLFGSLSNTALCDKRIHRSLPAPAFAA